MKKFLATLLAVLLVATVFAVPASALTWEDNQTQDENGDYVFDNAYGYVFNIKDVNGSITGEDNIIITSEDDYYSANPNWAISVLLAPTEDANIYTVVLSPIVCPMSAQTGIEKGISFDNGNICLVAHSSYSNPNGANWQSKLAAMALKVGDKVALKDIYLYEGLSNNGTVTVLDDPNGSATEPSIPVDPKPEQPDYPVDPKPEQPDYPVDPFQNVALGKPYTTSDQFRQGGADMNWGYDPNAPIAYPDEDGITMTDGILPPEYADFTSPEFAGWASALPEYMGYHRITIDLLDTFELTSLKLWYGTKMLGNGISAPDSVEAYISDNGIDWKFIDKIAPANDGSILNECVEFHTSVKARFVEFRVFKNSGWVFLTEAEVFTGYASSNPDHGDNNGNLEYQLQELLGKAPFDPKLDYVIEAPETYKAGDEITVTVTVKNITAENGVHILGFQMLYDNQKLILTNDLDESDNNILLCVNNLPAKWENFCNVTNTYDPDLAQGEEVTPLNDGVIYASVFTTDNTASTAINADGEMVFEFTFKALEDAKTEIGFVIPHATAQCGYNSYDAIEKYTANGGYAIVYCGSVPVDPEPPVDFDEEVICVDGDLSDNGWKEYGWIEVTPENGYWQSIPEFETISYRYQFRTDDEKLYVAFIVDCLPVEGGNGSGTNVRLWINSNDEATVYTHFYDVYLINGGTATNSKYNTRIDSNAATLIENSSIFAVLTTDGERTYVEYSIDLAEFNGTYGFNYFISVSNYIGENVCLYYPAMPEPAEGEYRVYNLPYYTWYTEGQGVVDVEEIKLNQGGESVDPEPDIPTPEPDGPEFDNPMFAQWGSGFDVLTDGYNGVGDITGWEGNESVLSGFMNLSLDKGEYQFTVRITPNKFNKITLYALDYWSGGVTLPESVEFIVNGIIYGAKITRNQNGIATIEAYLGETVKASEITVYAVMAASPYTFRACHMYSELETTIAKDEPVIPDIPDVTTNVALGKNYEISGCGNRGSYYGSITDGIAPDGIGGANWQAEWFGFYCNGDDPNNINAPDRVGYFIIDLEKTYNLESVRANLVTRTSWGLPAPTEVNVYTSDNGYDFKYVDSLPVITEDCESYWTEIQISEKARFVKVEFKLGGTFAFVSEIEVYASESAGTTEEQMKDALGNAFEDTKLDFDIEAPEYYMAGDDITVTVTVKNITAENGIHILTLKLFYDNEKLLLTNDLDEDDDNAVLCIKNLPNYWENLTFVANDYNPDNEEGTTVSPLNDGVININILTYMTTDKYAITSDGEIVLEFTFKALEDSTGDLGFVIPHAECEGALNGPYGAIVYNANGDYAITHQVTVIEGYAPDCTNEGLTEGLYCPECDKIIVEQQPIPALGHDDGEWITVIEPDVGKYGYAELRCTVCGEVLDTKELPMLCLLGDINNDGMINKFDYLLAKRIVMGTFVPDELQQQAADVHFIEGINIYDYLLIKRHVMGAYVIGE